jgi:hypothetical protein
MAMKKTSGGDSPLWQCAEKSFWTKTAENRELALWHLINRLVLENA